MSVVNRKQVFGAIILFTFLGLMPAVTQASSPSVTIFAPESIAVGTSVPACFLVQNDSIPVADATVNVSVYGGLSVSPASAITNATGYASVTLSAGTISGSVAVIASAIGASATQNLSIVAGPPASLQVVNATTLLPANTYSTSIINARVTDVYGNPCIAWPVNFTINGTRYSLSSNSNGVATYILSPRTTSQTCNVTVDANGCTASLAVRFLKVNMYMQDYPASVMAGQNVSITALLLDDLTPAGGIPLTFTVFSPGGLATPAQYTGTTGADGKVIFSFATSTVSGINTIVVSNANLGGDIRSASIRGSSGTVGQIILNVTPASPILADGVSSYTLKIWAKDTGGNPVKNEELTIVRNLVDNYSVITNVNGYKEINVGSSLYIGNVSFDAYAANGVTKSIEVAYVAGPPAITQIKAVPNVIASSEVTQQGGGPDIHSTDIIAQVMDEWHHPLPNSTITVMSLNTTAGTITGPTNGQTDENGEFYSTFTLGNVSLGMGTVDVRAVSGNMSSDFTITYTNNSFLSVDTSVSPRSVTVNETINVQVSIKGIGWNNRPQPVDMMLITDRSGSMDWYANMVYPTNGVPESNTTTQEDTYFQVGTFDNRVTKYPNLQFMLSSAFANYANGSYYYSLYVKDSVGNRYYGSNSQNENNLKITNVPTNPGLKYTVYAKFAYDSAGGYPPYSYSVLTRPYRLGSYRDTDSAAKVAARQLIDNMTVNDTLGLVSFNTASTLDSGLKSLTSSNKATLKSKVNSLDADGGTNMYTGIQKARQEFAANGRSSVKHVAILLTDGYSQSPERDIAEAHNARDDGIIIFTIGMGMADAATLGEIANVTGGAYYHVVSDLELAQRYNEIFKNVSEVVANDSSMSIMSARGMINGTVMSDAEYISGSAIVTFTNGTSAPVEPIITVDNTNYTMSWDPGAINVNQVWRVSYDLRVMHGGYLTPITGNSTITYTTSNNETGKVTIVSDSIFCRDSVGGLVTNPSPSLQVEMIQPKAEYDGVAVELKELQTAVSWKVTYTGSGTYDQKVYIMKGDGSSGEIWAEIARGFEGDRNSPGTFSCSWNLAQVPTGEYTITVYANDGTNDAAADVLVSIPFKNTEIILK